MLRRMSFYEEGRRRAVTVRGSKTASLIGKYDRDVEAFLDDPARDPSVLKKWEGRPFVDAYGTVHAFESDPAKILSAVERAESDTGAFEIYPDGGADEAAFVGAEA
jgi:hypothetical protein